MSTGNWVQDSNGNTDIGMKEEDFCHETEIAVIDSWNSDAQNIEFGVIVLDTIPGFVVNSLYDIEEINVLVF